MASFLLPSTIQKRLLRYALSRLELLDTEALDLEHLEISWGTKSTLEFRDVGLRLKVWLEGFFKRRILATPRSCLLIMILIIRS